MYYEWPAPVYRYFRVFSFSLNHLIQYRTHQNIFERQKFEFIATLIFLKVLILKSYQFQAYCVGTIINLGTCEKKLFHSLLISF